eukprot:g3476.t1
MEASEAEIVVKYDGGRSSVRRRLHPLRDSGDLVALEDFESIRRNMRRDGYVFVKSLLPASDVSRAERTVRRFHEKHFDMDDMSKGISYAGYRDITHCENVLKVVEAKPLFAFMSELFEKKNGESRTYGTKWLRAVAPGEQTSAHSDAFFFNTTRNRDMFTVWIPLGDVPMSKGALCVCERSHLLDGYAREAKTSTMDEMPSGFSSMASTLLWRSINFCAGDVLIFDERTIHASLPNREKEFRFSCDTRWQPKAEFDRTCRERGGK